VDIPAPSIQKRVPDQIARFAGEDIEEHFDYGEDHIAPKSDLEAPPHDGIRASSRSEDTEILEEDGDLDEEDGGNIDDFGIVGRLLLSVMGHSGIGVCRT
jgi:hypothetical protein